MKDRVVVTVIICSYNRVQTLGAALESAASQNLDPSWLLEIAIVDDGSTDGTERFVRQRAAGMPVPVRYFRETGNGIAHARNRGVREAQGEWVAFFDDDQLAESGWLNALLTTARETGARIVGGVRQLQGMEGRLPPWAH